MFFFRFQEFLSGHVVSYSAPAGARASEELFRSPDDEEDEKKDDSATSANEPLTASVHAAATPLNSVSRKEVAVANRATNAPAVTSSSPVERRQVSVKYADSPPSASNSTSSGDIAGPYSRPSPEAMRVSAPPADEHWTEFSGPVAAEMAELSGKGNSDPYSKEPNELDDGIDAHNDVAAIFTASDEDAAKKEFDRLFETNSHNTL